MGSLVLTARPTSPHPATTQLSAPLALSLSLLSTVLVPPIMLRVTAVLATLCLGDSVLGLATSRDSGYSAPEQSYQQPSYDGYEASSAGYQATDVGASPDITPILIGVLVLTGLALLFPSYVNLTSVRRKRSSEGIQDDSAAGNMVERLQDMYMALMESEECMERIACEVGGLVTDAGISKSMTKMAGQFVPKKYTKMMKTFNHGKDCKKNNKCGLF